MDAFMEEVNKTSKCKTQWCKGRLQQQSILSKGKGGAVEIVYKCDGCTKKTACDRKVTFNSTVQVFQSRRLVTNLAIAVAFIVSGCMYSDMHKVMALGLGMHVLTEANFYNVIKLMYGPVCDLLNAQLESAKIEMKLKPQQDLGSRNRSHL